MCWIYIILIIKRHEGRRGSENISSCFIKLLKQNDAKYEHIILSAFSHGKKSKHENNPRFLQHCQDFEIAN